MTDNLPTPTPEPQTLTLGLQIQGPQPDGSIVLSVAFGPIVTNITLPKPAWEAVREALNTTHMGLIVPSNGLIIPGQE